MKRIFRTLIISSFSLYLVNRLFPDGLVWDQKIPTLIIAGAGLTIANLLVRPLFSIIMLPINLLTFGLFRWVTNVVLLFLVVYLVDGIKVQAFNFPGLTYSGIVIPIMYFNSIMAWIVISFVLSFISGLMIWMIKK